MPRRFPATPVVLFGFLLPLFLAGAGSGDDIQKVHVTNFPPLQQVAGTVSVDGTIRHAVPLHFKEIVVPPVNPGDVSRLISAGTLEADGFTSVVLALNGQSRGKIPLKSGIVGAILVPDEEPIQRIFLEEGIPQFPIEIKTAALTGVSPYVASALEQSRVGFPRYRIWLYNTSDRTVSANLYAYLTN